MMACIAYKIVLKRTGGIGETTIFNVKKNPSGFSPLLKIISEADFPVAIEIAVQHLGDKTEYYLSVSKENKKPVEKLLKKIMPDAEYEESDDYIIFHHGGHADGRYADLNKKDFEKIDIGKIDLSKVNEIGEGAAIQIIKNINEGEKSAARIFVVASAPGKKQVKEIIKTIEGSEFIKKEMKEPKDINEFFDDFNRRSMMEM